MVPTAFAVPRVAPCHRRRRLSRSTNLFAVMCAQSLHRSWPSCRPLGPARDPETASGEMLLIESTLLGDGVSCDHVAAAADHRLLVVGPDEYHDLLAAKRLAAAAAGEANGFRIK